MCNQSRHSFVLRGFLFAVLSGTLLAPSGALASNLDPFRSGREAVTPKQSVGVGQFTGAMTYSYPIVIPPGRNGMQPNLSLNYSSDDKRQDSLFGYGWSMNIPYIERVNKLGTNNFYNQDKYHTFFTSSLSGELLPFESTTDIGGFLGVTLSTPQISPVSEIAPSQALIAADKADAVSVSKKTQATPVFADGDFYDFLSVESPVDSHAGHRSVDLEQSVSGVIGTFEAIAKTFLPIFVYHPKEEEEYNLLREQASADARLPIPGDKMPETPHAQADIEGQSLIIEEVDARTVTAKQFRVEKGDSVTTMYKIYSSPIHYRDSKSGAFEEIDTRIIEDEEGFRMEKASYVARVAKKTNEPLLVFAHDGQELVISTPLGQDEKRIEGKRASAEMDAAEVSYLDERQVRFPGFIDDGIDLEITTLDTKLTKEIVVTDKSALGDLSVQEYVEFPFEISSTEPISVNIEGVQLEMGFSATSSGLVTIANEHGVSTYIYPPKVIDASSTQASIEIVYTKTDTGFRMIKRIPASFFSQAHYPIRTDATFSVYPPVGDGTSYYVSTTWAGAHDTMTGGSGGGVSDGWYVTIENDRTGASEYRINRGFLPFDTSVIPDTATVATATLHIYAAGRSLHGDSYDYLAVVGPTTQATTSWLYGSDFASCGATSSPTYLSDRTATSGDYWADSFATTSIDFTLNATGLAAVSKTGSTLLGMREGHDIANVAPTAQATRYWLLTSGDNANGENKPYLEVVTAADGPTTPTGLFTETLTNPSNISTGSPRFSAVFQSSIATDTASYYRIQISTSSVFATTVWDSGKAALSSTTPGGMRSPNIYATSTLDVDGTKYYWRIAFWGQDNTMSPWSTSADYFIMQLAGEYMAKVDDGSFMRYTLQEDGSWIAYDKRGWKYIFGASTNGRLHNLDQSSEIYRWYLEDVIDPNGNKMIYRYSKDGGQVYPDYIDYTSNTNGSGPLFDIDFSRDLCSTGTSPCAPFATSSMYGFPVFTKYIISDITAAVNGTIVHRYTPTYTTGDNGSRLLISSMTEKGYRDSDGGGMTSLPQTTFSYQTSTTTWTQVTDPSAYQVGFDVSDTSNNDYGWRLFDANGDALPDWLRSDGGTQTTLLNTGIKWSTSSAWTIPVMFASSNAEQGVRMAEVNGDGLVDIIAASTTKVVYLNNGTSTWTASTTWSFPVSFIDSGNRDQGVQIVDINGDGLADVLQAHYASTTGTTSAVYINDGHGWTEDTGWSVPEVLINDLKDSAVRLYDYNGDGLVDIIYAPYPYTTAVDRIYFNTGNGWDLDVAGDSPLEFSEVSASIGTADRGVRFADFNSDGCVDMAQGLTSITKRVYVSDCQDGWTLAAENTLPEYFRDTASDYGVRIDDINGDGLLDITRSFYDSGSVGRTRKVYLKNGEAPDMLKEVVNSRGGKTTVGYQASAEYFTESGALANPYMPFVAQTARTITTDNGSFLTGHRVIATTTYDYQRGYYYGTGTDPLLRQFGGYGLVMESLPQGKYVRTYFHQGNGSDTDNGEYVDHISKAGRAYRIDIADGTTTSANLYAQTKNNWARTEYADGRSFVKLDRRLDNTYDGDTSVKSRGVQYNYNTSTGNLNSIADYGEVTGLSSGSFFDSGADQFVMSFYYASSSTLPTMSLVHRDSTIDYNNSLVRETLYYYDGLSAGLVSKGNLTKQEFLKSGTTYLNTQRAYDAYGNTSSTTDQNGNVTTILYDGYNLLPATSTNALSQSTRFSYDYSSGKIATTTDANNHSIATDYDVLDRPIRDWQPNIYSPSQYVVRAEYTYTDATTSPSSVFKREYLQSATSTDSYVYSDGFARSIQVKKEAESQNGWTVGDTLFGGNGFVAQASLPYFHASSAYTQATSATALYTTNTYDSVGRIKTVANTLGTTTYSYSDWRTTATDALGNKKDLISDAFGNLASVVEWSSSTTSATTTYAWNGNKKLTKITDALGNVRNFSYDYIGRLTGSEDLHAAFDTSFGSTTYQYDSVGNLTTLQGPRGNTTTYVYDALNRITSENDASTTVTDMTYTYDSCTYGVGRLCDAVTTDGYYIATTSYIYYPMGLISDEIRSIKYGSISTNSNGMGFDYYRNGAWDTLFYPDSAQVRYNYDDSGHLSGIDRKESGGSFSAVISRVDYAPNDLTTVITYGNGVISTSTYDQANQYRLTRLATQLAGTAAYQNAAYTYDAVGNLTNLDDQASTTGRKTIAYTYDNLYRLASASTTAVATTTTGYRETYSYDALGNLTNKSNVGSYTYAGTGFANPDAATSINGVTYSYDNAGNLTTYGSTTNAYDWRNRLGTTTLATSTSTYFYDTNNARVFMKDVSTTTRYAGGKFYFTTPGPYERWKNIYLSPSGPLIGVVKKIGSSSVTPYSIHPDPLNSAAIATNISGTLRETLDYYPFGGIRRDDLTSTFETPRKFIGETYDPATQLSYLNARYYDGGNGKFISQDPMFTGDPNRQRLLDPQQLNSYNYARNNPINGSDPSGEALTTQQILGVAAQYASGNLSATQSVASLLSMYVKDEVKQTGVVIASNLKQSAQNLNMLNPSATPEQRINAAMSFSPGGATKAVGAGGKAIWTATKELSPVGNALKHFNKHGDDFGAQNSVDYVKKAREFLFSPPNGTQTITRTSGERVLYHEESNTFGILSNESTPQTFFKPDPAIHGRSTNLEYFYDQQY